MMLSGPWSLLGSFIFSQFGYFPLSADEDHGARRLNEAWLIDAVALFFFHDNGTDVSDQVLVGGSLAQQRPQIMIVLAEQAGAELAIGSQPDAGAMTTEGLGHRGDEADFAGGAISEAVFAGGFAALVGDLFERPVRVDAAVNLRGRHNEGARPVAVGIERHELYETHDDARFAGKQSKGFDFVVVDAANQDGVHFGRRQA